MRFVGKHMEPKWIIIWFPLGNKEDSIKRGHRTVE
jgi:hypothetical protein